MFKAKMFRSEMNKSQSILRSQTKRTEFQDWERITFGFVWCASWRDVGGMTLLVEEAFKAETFKGRIVLGPKCPSAEMQVGWSWF